MYREEIKIMDCTVRDGGLMNKWQFDDTFVKGVYQACVDAGIGATVELEAGGKTDDLHGDPVAIRGVVQMLDDGKFEDSGPTHGGFRFYNAGPRALIHTDDDHTPDMREAL